MNNNITNKTLTGFLRLPQVLELYPVSRSTWWQGVSEGKFPQPVKLTARTTAWAASDIKKLIDEVSGNNQEVCHD